MTKVIARTLDLRMSLAAQGVVLSVAVLVVQLVSLLIGGVISPILPEW